MGLLSGHTEGLQMWCTKPHFKRYKTAHGYLYVRESFLFVFVFPKYLFHYSRLLNEQTSARDLQSIRYQLSRQLTWHVVVQAIEQILHTLTNLGRTSSIDLESSQHYALKLRSSCAHLMSPSQLNQSFATSSIESLVLGMLIFLMWLMIQMFEEIIYRKISLCLWQSLPWIDGGLWGHDSTDDLNIESLRNSS